MKTAYDIKDLGKKLENAGLPLIKNCAEETAKVVYKEVKTWLQESATISENKIDDVVMPFIGQLDSIVLPQIDKIDGEVGA